jgi:hypothetical protein
MKKILWITIVLIGSCPIQQSLWADPIVIDFESLSDLEAVASQFPGLTFSNATALVSGSSGGSLNEVDFPPFSGITVVSDDGGPLSVSFLSPVLNFGGFFTYTVLLTLEGFDAGNSLVASAVSSSSSNLEFLGGVPNEFVGFGFSGGISKVIITGDAVGNSFTLDDLTYTPQTTSVPEPLSLSLLVAGIAGLVLLNSRRQK